MVFRYSCLTLKIIAVLALAFVTQSNLSGAQFAPGTGPADQLQLPPPFATPSARNTSKVIGWPAGKTPTAVSGFTVSRFAEKLDNPRWVYALPNEDILVVEAMRDSPNRPGNRPIASPCFATATTTALPMFAKLS